MQSLWQVCLFGWNRVWELVASSLISIWSDRMWKEGKDSASKEEIFTSQTELYPVKAPIHQNIYQHFVLFSFSENFSWIIIRSIHSHSWKMSQIWQIRYIRVQILDGWGKSVRERSYSVIKCSSRKILWGFVFCLKPALFDTIFSLSPQE